MATVKSFPQRRLEVRAGPREHAPPHFHIVTMNADASFLIQTFAQLVGKLPKEGQDALIWAKQNQAILQRTWDSLHKPRSKP